MRWLLIAAVMAATPAYAGKYVLVCSTPCPASDGTIQPAGTALNRVLWDGVAPYTPPGVFIVLDTGQTLYAPPVAAQTTLASLAFMDRFTLLEYKAIAALDPRWPTQVAAVETVDVTGPRVVAGMQAAVAGGAITAARRDQVLDLSRVSP